MMKVILFSKALFVEILMEYCAHATWKHVILHDRIIYSSQVFPTTQRYRINTFILFFSLSAPSIHILYLKSQFFQLGCNVMSPFSFSDNIPNVAPSSYMIFYRCKISYELLYQELIQYLWPSLQGFQNLFSLYSAPLIKVFNHAKSLQYLTK